MPKKAQGVDFARFSAGVDRTLRQIRGGKLRYKSLSSKTPPLVTVKSGCGYAFDDVVPRSHLIAVGVYHVLSAIRLWREHHPKRKSVPWDQVEEWIQGLDLTIPIELDPIIRDAKPR